MTAGWWVTAAAEAWHTAGLGYSRLERRSDGSGRTGGGRVTAESASRARSNTGGAAAAVAAAADVVAVVAAVVVDVAAVAAAAAAVALLHNGQHTDKRLRSGYLRDGATATQGHKRQGAYRQSRRRDVIAYWVMG